MFWFSIQKGTLSLFVCLKILWRAEIPNKQTPNTDAVVPGRDVRTDVPAPRDLGLGESVRDSPVRLKVDARRGSGWRCVSRGGFVRLECVSVSVCFPFFLTRRGRHTGVGDFCKVYWQGQDLLFVDEPSLYRYGSSRGLFTLEGPPPLNERVSLLGRRSGPHFTVVGDRYSFQTSRGGIRFGTRSTRKIGISESVTLLASPVDRFGRVYDLREKGTHVPFWTVKG